MKSRGLKVTIIIGILAVLALVGWTFVQNSWRDRSLLTGSPCDLPCWQGIVPGVTSSVEAIEILQGLPYVKKGSVKQSGTAEVGGCTWQWRTSGKRILPGMTWQNGTVDTITLGLNYELSVIEIMDRLGVPEAISTITGGTPERWYWIVTFYYPNQGIELKAFTSEFENQLEPSTEVGIVSLFIPRSMEERVDDIEKEIAAPLPENFLMQWKGYGNIGELYVETQGNN